MRTEAAARIVVLLVVLGALAAPWLLAGCTSRPPEHDLPFETIERGDYSLYYHQHPLEPQHLFLIASTQEAARLAGWVSSRTQEQLAQIDYKSYFVLALFRGNFGSSGYDAIIQRVTRQGDRLVVQAQFWAPSPYYAVTAAESEPHHVIKVLRDDGLLEEAQLVLETQLLTPTPPPEIRRLTPTPAHR